MNNDFTTTIQNISQCWYLKDVLDVATNNQRTDGRYPKRIGSTFWQVIVPGIGKSAALFTCMTIKATAKTATCRPAWSRA